ncbi:MAG: MATE family efflux transporter [Terrisporobacter othiniensis]|uniref:MATE family efflux transporter n=1 Tax=Terrisporobacter petrolearius TaxID=1460447 RepID=UPI0022DF549A|nr:MATE family efflux transporter [Terrisporobacter petrolearius]MDU4859789.1 MATE family efflux transporter [Terrisporobacter othiniensis]MDU6994042.1 MATE family efflux transporter [Terrisporobacter othiniensis]
MDQKILETEKLLKLFIKFTIPSIIGMVFLGIQGIIDGLFVGNVIGENALASVNLVQPYMQIIMAYALVIGVGAQSVIGINLGKGENEKAQNIFRTSLILLTLISILVMMFGIFFSDKIAIFLGANEVLLEGASTYIKIISYFIVFVSLMFLFEMIVRTIGKPNISLVSMILAVLLNVVLDYLLINKLNLGIKGAAVATGISYASAFFINIIPFLSKKTVVNLYNGKFDGSCLFPMVYNGSSEGISSLSNGFSMFLFNTALMKIAGESGIAAFSIINYIAQVGYMVLFGISDGVRPIISYNYGAENEERVNKTLKASIIVNLLIGIIIFIVMEMFSQPLINVFLKDGKSVLEMATTGAKIYGIAFLFNGVNILISSYFTAIDDPMSSIIVAASRGLLFIAVGIFILPYIFGINGIWGSIVFAEVITIIICFKLLKNRIKKKD